MFYVVLIVLAGLTINAKSGIDRIIYGALAAAAMTALVYHRGAPAQMPWSF
jgi:hypothetical protein